MSCAIAHTPLADESYGDSYAYARPYRSRTYYNSYSPGWSYGSYGYDRPGYAYGGYGYGGGPYVSVGFGGYGGPYAGSYAYGGGWGGRAWGA